MTIEPLVETTGSPPRLLQLIDGEQRPAIGEQWIDSIEPAFDSVWARIPAGEGSDVDAAVDAARRAFESCWRETPALQRAAPLRRVGELIARHADELARLESRDNGRAIVELSRGELPAITQMFYYWAGAADKLHGETVQISSSSFNYTLPEPIGVVGIIIPWNAPLSLFTAKVGAALAAGNTVVVKPAEQAACSVLAIGRLFEAAGFPPGVVNIVSGLGETAGDAIVRHPGVGKISFTGATDTARTITERSAPTLKRLSFELGGKSPNIIFADADLAAAAVGASTIGIFTGGAGQICVAGSRILIESSIYDEMLERIEARVRRIVIGDPTDPKTRMGPIAFREQYEKVCSYIELGRKEGAQLAFGGRFGAELFEAGSALGRGYFVAPTLFRDARNDMRICREEIFGPVACAIPFDSEEEAVALANDSSYGLACGIWTSDLKRAHRMVANVQAGAVWVNAYCRIHWAVPFGGIKDSGYGRDSGLESLRGYLQTKSVWIDLA